MLKIYRKITHHGAAQASPSATATPAARFVASYSTFALARSCCAHFFRMEATIDTIPSNYIRKQATMALFKRFHRQQTSNILVASDGERYEKIPLL
jgi:hypothetical protein